MIAAFELRTRQGELVYCGTVEPSRGVTLRYPGGEYSGLHYKSIGACYEALCGKRESYLWRTVDR